jgi:hypothetical protein
MYFMISVLLFVVEEAPLLMESFCVKSCKSLKKKLRGKVQFLTVERLLSDSDSLEIQCR